MKHLNFILAGLFFLCGLCCRAQVLPLEENVVLNTKEGQIKGKLLLPGGVKTCPVVLIIAGSGPTDMDGNSAIGNLRNNSLKFLAEGLAANGIASLRFDKRGIGTSASAGKEEAKLRFEDYVNDVTGWIDYLAKEKRFTTITVAGHSEGALIGMLACQKPAEGERLYLDCRCGSSCLRDYRGASGCSTESGSGAEGGGIH